MKKRIITALLGITMAFFLAGCNNNTPTQVPVAGPTGPTGPTGPEGTQGPKGSDGADGHTPEITIGENGNWFIDGVDTEVYAGERVVKKEDTSTNEIKNFDLLSMIPEALVPQYQAVMPSIVPDTYVSGDLLINNTDLGEEKIDLLFNSELPNIPFIELGNYTDYLNESSRRQLKDQTTGEITKNNPALYNYENGVASYVLTHVNGSKSEAYFDYEKQTIITHNITGLCVNTNTNSSLFPNALGTTQKRDSNESFQYYRILEGEDTFIDGNYCSIDLDDYSTIKIVKNEDKLYIPLQTANDLFDPQMQLYFNGFAIYSAIGNNIIDSTNSSLNVMGLDMKEKENRTALEKELYYKHEYDELCFLIDNKFGLKDTHSITKADDLLSKTSVKEKMLAGKEADALSDLVNGCLDDNGHSTFTSVGYLEDIAEYSKTTVSKEAYRTKGKNLILAGIDAGLIDNESKQYITPINVVNGTMYIMFREFTASLDGAIHYKNPYPFYNSNNELVDIDDLSPDQLSLLASDNIYLMSYAVLYANSHDEIKNVVLDLSINSGGLVDAAYAVIGGFLGADAFTYFVNPNDSSSCITKYFTDLNFDGKFDENDYFNNKKLYCLTAGISFSCGNLVPTVFKTSSKVTLIGRQTGGGSCLVLDCTTASVTKFSLSSSIRMYGYKNGAKVNVEFGVTPDIILNTDMEFYDRGPSSTLGRLFS